MNYKKLELTLEQVLKLRDVYYKLHYGEKLYQGGLYPEQLEISNAIIEQFINGHIGKPKKDIYINITRQFGKSFAVFSTIGFLLIYMAKLFNKPITVGITINKNKQAKKNYTEVRDVLKQSIGYYGLTFFENTSDSIRLSNGSKIVIFSMEADHNEGETLDFSLVDEAQDLDEAKYEKEIFPMLARTGGVSCYVGVGGYRKNGYYYGLLNSSENIIIKYDCYQVAKTAKKRYEETKDERHLLYVESLNEAKKKSSTEGFGTQFELKWFVSGGNFINIEDFLNYKLDYKELKEVRTKIKSYYIGIDWAKTNDRTVVSISGEEEGKHYLIDTFQIKEYGTPYTKQAIEIIRWLIKKEYISKVRRVYMDSTGVGKAVVDIFREKIQGIDIEEVTFGEKSKHLLAVTFRNLYESGALFYTSSEEKNLEELEKELKHLELEYRKNGYLNYHHPEKGDIHDDYVDSFFLSLQYNLKPEVTGGNVTQSIQVTTKSIFEA